jgi:hypothetical protein
MVKLGAHVAALAAVLRFYARHGDGFLSRPEIAEMFSATLTADEVDAVINAGLAARVFVEEAPRGLRIAAPAS